MKLVQTEYTFIEQDYVIQTVTTEILPGIKLEVYDGTSAVLYLGKNEIEFDWNEQAAQIFEDIDTCDCEPLELLMLLSNFTYKEPCDHVYSFNQTGGAIRFTCAKCGQSELIPS